MKDIMQGKCFIKDIFKLGIELFKIIEKLHDVGICHLDIKPDNVMFDN